MFSHSVKPTTLALAEIEKFSMLEAAKLNSYDFSKMRDMAEILEEKTAFNKEKLQRYSDYGQLHKDPSHESKWKTDFGAFLKFGEQYFIDF